MSGLNSGGNIPLVSQVSVGETNTGSAAKAAKEV